MAMRWISLSVLGALLAGCGGPECDADGLTSALAGAGSGDVVRVGSCRIEGEFAVPAGVTLEGEPGSVIDGRIDLSGGGRVAHLAIESSDAGLVALDGGAVVIEDVQITASAGTGMAADGVASLELSNVTLRGPVNAGNVSLLQGSVPDRDQTATHGLILVNVPDAAISDLSVRGFARFGALLKDSSTSWSGGDASENAWVGIMVAGGSASISDVQVHDTLDLGIDHASTFGVVTGTAAITTARLSVDGTEGFGLFHLRGSAMHQDLTANANAYGAVRLELTTAAEISGTMADNDFGAVIAYGAENLVIRDATIENSARALRAETDARMIEAGDGIQLVDSVRGARIENTTITGNDRAGIVIDLFGGNLAPGLFDGVTVSRDDPTENGVLVQRGTRDPGWSDGLMRDAATVQADDAVTASVDIVGAVGPCFFPAPQ